MSSKRESKSSLRIMVIGAHPDDCDVRAGGCAAIWSAAGHRVQFVSATNGQSGHHADGLAKIIGRRAAEAQAAADVIGIESRVLPIPDGQMEPSFQNRLLFIRAIREFAPDLILTHRPGDYHPDHRYTSQLVQDSTYMVRVPHIAPETPALRRDPAVAYMFDRFQKPAPFHADFVVAIDSVMDKKMEMIHRHTSQMYEWIPWIEGELDQVPADDAGRRKFLADRWAVRSSEVADLFRQQLIGRHGPKSGKAVQYAEAFEICEYGGKLSQAQQKALFGT